LQRAEHSGTLPTARRATLRTEQPALQTSQLDRAADLARELEETL